MFLGYNKAMWDFFFFFCLEANKFIMPLTIMDFLRKKCNLDIMCGEMAEVLLSVYLKGFRVVWVNIIYCYLLDDKVFYNFLVYCSGSFANIYRILKQ